MVDFFLGLHDHIHWGANTAQATISASCAASGTFQAARYNYANVHITVGVGFAPRVRAEEDNLVRIEFGHQALDNLLKQVGGDGFHGNRSL